MVIFGVQGGVLLFEAAFAVSATVPAVVAASRTAVAILVRCMVGWWMSCNEGDGGALQKRCRREWAQAGRAAGVKISTRRRQLPVVLLRVHEDVVAAVDDRLGGGRFEPELVAAELVGEPSVMVESGRLEPDRDDAGVEAGLPEAR